MYKPKRKRPCKVCGIDLNQWGPDRKSPCPDCAKAVKDTIVPCAGRCKQKLKIRAMEKVVLYFEPGIKGGKKFTLHYCQQCFAAAKSRARTVNEFQQQEVQKAENRRARATKGRKRGGDR